MVGGMVGNRVRKSRVGDVDYLKPVVTIRHIGVVPSHGYTPSRPAGLTDAHRKRVGWVRNIDDRQALTFSYVGVVP
jgi:hypothetical protein